MITYDPSNWYWRVGADQSRYWSSAKAAYVPAADPTFKAWQDAGGHSTPIDTEDSLKAVLDEQYPAGWPAGPNRYVPAWLARQRLEPMGKWVPLVTYLLANDPATLFKLCTLERGLDPADQQVRGLLLQLGLTEEQVEEVLAPQ
jgi:hypothetical protein